MAPSRRTAHAALPKAHCRLDLLCPGQSDLLECPSILSPPGPDDKQDTCGSCRVAHGNIHRRKSGRDEYRSTRAALPNRIAREHPTFAAEQIAPAAWQSKRGTKEQELLLPNHILVEPKWRRLGPHVHISRASLGVP